MVASEREERLKAVRILDTYRGAAYSPSVILKSVRC